MNHYFDSLTEGEQERVMKIVAKFHCRNALEHEDGSLGEIRITLKEFNNVLAKFLIETDGRIE